MASPSSTKWLRPVLGLRGAGAMARVALGGRAPVKVSFHITYRCNLTCGYCGRREAECRELDPEEVGRLLERYHALGCAFWTWNGGEPLIRPDIEAHVEHAARLGMRQLLVSNCALLPKRASVLDSLKLLEASLDGPPEIHDRVRGPGSFAAVERGLALAAGRGVAVQLLVVLTKTSAPHLRWLLEFARSSGAGLTIQPVAPHRELPGHSVGDWVPTARELREAAEWLESERPRGGVAASRGYLEMLAGKRAAPDCWAGRFFRNVRPDGSEAPCCARLHETLSADLDARSCRDCLHVGPQEVNLALSPSGLARAAANALRGSPPWWHSTR